MCGGTLSFFLRVKALRTAGGETQRNPLPLSRLQEDNSRTDQARDAHGAQLRVLVGALAGHSPAYKTLHFRLLPRGLSRNDRELRQRDLLTHWFDSNQQALEKYESLMRKRADSKV